MRKPYLASIIVLCAVAGAVPAVAAARSAQIRAGDKVRVTRGALAGRVGAVLSVSRRAHRNRPYRVRTAAGVRRFARRQLRGLGLAVGDRVRVTRGRWKLRRGLIVRVASRRVRSRYVVNLTPGPVRRFSRAQLAFLGSTGRGPAGSGVPTPPPPPAPPPRHCDVTTASAAGVRAAVQVNAGKTICYQGAIAGDLDLSSVRPAAVTTIAPAPGGGSFSGGVNLPGAANITFEGRAAWATMYSGTANVTLQNCTLGGTPTNRLSGEDIVHIQADARDIAIRDCSIGWSSAAVAGYGIRIVDNGTVDKVTIQRNRIHHIGADGIQVGGTPSNLTIDRNEISYVAVENPDLDQHADLIQLVDYGPNTRITNNYMHHLGYPVEGSNPPKSYPSGGLYIHGGDDGPLLFENNLVVDGRNQAGIGDLGTGGCSVSNFTMRRNTFDRMGTAVGGLDFGVHICSGANNLVERNAIRDFDNHYPGPWVTVRNNVEDAGVVLNAAGECISTACNPPGQEPIGYRKPAGVGW